MVFMSDVLFNLPNPNKGLEEVYRVLKDDGFFYLSEVGFHSDPLQNAGNMHAAMLHVVVMFTSLTTSLAEPPHTGFGPIRDVDEIEKTLRHNQFEMDKDAIVRINNKVCFNCTKVV